MQQSTVVNRGLAALGLAMGLLAGVLLAACPRQGVLCPQGQALCDGTCRDTGSDSRNCGGCGITCGGRQVCQQGACVCQGGTTSCGGECVSTASDPRHCGGCADAGGAACESGWVCESGECKVSCSVPGYTRCGDSCVDLSADERHCGGCGAACPDNQSCRGGRCGYDVIAACQSNGQVVGLQASTGFTGPSMSAAPSVESLAALGDVLLEGDGYVDSRLYQARLTSSPGLDGGVQPALELLPATATVGNDARHLWVEDPYVYVVNAGTNTLQVLRREGAADGGGLALATVGELNFGANTNPQAIAKLGTRAFVPLYGTTGAEGIDAGQRVAVVDLSAPAAPAVEGHVSLGGLDLQPFSGTSIARPSWITSHQGALYLPLNNLDATYTPNGPGLLARLDPTSLALSTIDLGSDVCLNAVSVASAGDAGLVVGCAGQSDFSNWPEVTTQKTGVVLVRGDSRVAAWSASCPADAGAGCASPSVGRLAVVGTRVLAADQAAGRVFVLDIAGGALVERRGYSSPDGGGPILACPVGPAGYSNVADLYAP